MGWLTRAHGLRSTTCSTSDLVTANGEQVHASAPGHPRALLGRPRRRLQLRGRDQLRVPGRAARARTSIAGARYYTSPPSGWTHCRLLRRVGQYDPRRPHHHRDLDDSDGRTGLPEHLTGAGRCWRSAWCWAGPDIGAGERAVADLAACRPTRPRRRRADAVARAPDRGRRPLPTRASAPTSSPPTSTTSATRSSMAIARGTLAPAALAHRRHRHPPAGGRLRASRRGCHRLRQSRRAVSSSTSGASGGTRPMMPARSPGCAPSGRHAAPCSRRPLHQLPGCRGCARWRAPSCARSTPPAPGSDWWRSRTAGTRTTSSA